MQHKQLMVLAGFSVALLIGGAGCPEPFRTQFIDASNSEPTVTTSSVENEINAIIHESAAHQADNRSSAK